MIHRQILSVAASSLALIPSASATQPVNIDKAVQNPALLKAWVKMSKGNSVDAQNEFALELQRATYLVAFIDAGMIITPGKKPGEVTLEKGSKFIVPKEDYDGKFYLPLFPDWKALWAYSDKRGYKRSTVKAWVMVAREAWGMALAGHEYDGAVLINDELVTIPIERTILESFHRIRPK